MKLELYLFLITGFLIYNTYHDGKYTNMIKINVKYVKMAMYAFSALSMYLFFKKNPTQSKNLLFHANDLIKFIPIDKNTTDMIAPFINMTNENIMFNGGGYNNSNIDNNMNYKMMQNANQQMQQPQSNIKHKRSVSETKKKYVASNQGWKCGHCNQQLDYSYEVDHIVDLQHGGSNETDNLVALCRNCHGKKTLRNYL